MSMFSMPDFKVTDELGQPLQAPCILSFTIPVSLQVNINENIEKNWVDHLSKHSQQKHKGECAHNVHACACVCRSVCECTLAECERRTRQIPYIQCLHHHLVLQA